MIGRVEIKGARDLNAFQDNVRTFVSASLFIHPRQHAPKVEHRLLNSSRLHRDNQVVRTASCTRKLIEGASAEIKASTKHFSRGAFLF